MKKPMVKPSVDNKEKQEALREVVRSLTELVSLAYKIDDCAVKELDARTNKLVVACMVGLFDLAVTRLERIVGN